MSWSAMGLTLRVSRSTIMYSSSMPKPSKRDNFAFFTGLAPAAAILDAAEEGLHHAQIQPVFEDGVFESRINIGVVVDFDDVAPISDLLEVDAVEAVSYEVGGSQGGLHDLPG